MITKRILNPDRSRRIGKGFSFIPHRFLTGGFFILPDAARASIVPVSPFSLQSLFPIKFTSCSSEKLSSPEYNRHPYL